MLLSSIQSAYDDDMAILKASETSASRYAGSKILVNASGTIMLLSFEENWRTRTLLHKLRKHTAERTQQLSATVMVVARFRVQGLGLWSTCKSSD